MGTQRLDKNREKFFALIKNNGKIKKLEKESPLLSGTGGSRRRQ